VAWQLANVEIVVWRPFRSTFLTGLDDTNIGLQR